MPGSGMRTDDKPQRDDRPIQQSVGNHSKVWRRALSYSLRSLQDHFPLAYSAKLVDMECNKCFGSALG